MDGLEIVLSECRRGPERDDAGMDARPALALEPGAAETGGGDFGLWAVDRGAAMARRFDRDGLLTRTVSLMADSGGPLDGLVFVRGVEDRIVAVQSADDGRASLLRLSLPGGDVRRMRLSDLAGYGTVTDPMDPAAMTVSAAFDAGSGGLAGIAWRPGSVTGSGRAGFYVLKRSSPAVLLEIAPDFSEIRDMVVLNHGDHASGFTDMMPFPDHPSSSGPALGFSGIAYDPRRDRFWILSGDAGSVSLWDHGRRGYRTFSLPAQAGQGACLGLAVLPDYCGTSVDALAIARTRDRQGATDLAILALNDPSAMSHVRSVGGFRYGRHARGRDRDRSRRANAV